MLIRRCASAWPWVGPRLLGLRDSKTFVQGTRVYDTAISQQPLKTPVIPQSCTYIGETLTYDSIMHLSDGQEKVSACNKRRGRFK